MWEDTINKEKMNVKCTFKFLRNRAPHSFRYRGIICFIIYTLKIDLTRKTRFITGDHTTDPPTSMSYTSVVSRDSVQISFLLVALNALEILSVNIGNMYLKAYTIEKTYCRASLEWGLTLEGSVRVIICTLYDLKTSTNAWRQVLCPTLKRR